MKIRLNGSEYVTEAKTIASLLEELGISADRVAVEQNLSIVKRTEFQRVTIKDGDNIEIVNFVGGG